MMPSAVSQILEQLANAVVSIWAAYVLFSYGTKVGAILGDAENYGSAYGAATFLRLPWELFADTSFETASGRL